MKSEPSVSVLIPVHKDNPYLQDALTSLSQQTYENLEILFLDNSEIGLSQDIWSKHPKLKYVRVAAGCGLSRALNFGIKYSESEYLARMDYDDICKPNRIREQIEFLESHPDIDILGSAIMFIGEVHDPYALVGSVASRPNNPDVMQSYICEKNPLFHPTVVMRRTSMISNNLFYNPKYDGAEDYELWMRASRKLRISNLNSVLLEYRLHTNQLSRIGSRNTNYLADKIRLRQICWLIFHKPASHKIMFKLLLIRLMIYAKHAVLKFFKSADK